MLPMERLNKIKAILTEKKQLDVSTLSAMLNVTETTVRRDLEKLENESFLIRTHGGALLCDDAQTASSLYVSNDVNETLYNSISSIAVHFINDGDVIFLGPGISTKYIARCLTQKRALTIVTNDLIVAHDCSQYSSNVQLMVPGGTVNPSNLQIYGRLTDLSLKSFLFDIAFFDIDGVSLTRGFTVSSLEKTYLIQDTMRIAKKNIAVCDYTKFSIDSTVSVGPLTTFQTVISNEQAPIEYKEYFFQNHIQLFGTFDAYRG